jgi:hypothetical protein
MKGVLYVADEDQAVLMDICFLFIQFISRGNTNFVENICRIKFGSFFSLPNFQSIAVNKVKPLISSKVNKHQKDNHNPFMTLLPLPCRQVSSK